MGETRSCPECGAPVPESGPAGGLCPRCLMKEGLASQSPTRTGGASGGRFVPPDPEELAERFPNLEILDLIGRGGMGAVYKARQPGLDRLVALKILDPDRVRDPAFAERFSREARTLARLSNPYIVGIHDFGVTDGLYFLVMEYVDGASLREVMQAGRLSPRDALALVPQICEALQFAHEAGVVHRDVKPENILLDRSGRVKIADFGLAKLLDPGRADGVSLTVSGETMGTPAYMAPEQIEHPLDVDHRADIYAVGVVFYEMLTGELPLGRFDPPSKKVRMDIRLDQVVLRALAKEPTRRYQFARDVKADVESLGGDATAGAAAPPPADDTGSPADDDGRWRTPGAVGEPGAPRTRTVAVARPPVVAWIAAYSFLMAAGWTLVSFGTPLLLVARVFLGMPDPFTFPGPGLGRAGGLFAMAPLLVSVAAVIGLAFAIWHCIAGFGALRLRNWARYNLIVLASLELPGALIAFRSAPLLGLLPAIASALLLVYLFRPTVARVFELGPGPATLPSAEADAVERVTGRRRWA